MKGQIQLIFFEVEVVGITEKEDHHTGKKPKLNEKIIPHICLFMLRIADKILKLSIVDVCEIGLGYDPCEYVKNIRIKALLNSFEYTYSRHIPFQYT